MATTKTIPIRADISATLHPDALEAVVKVLSERHQQAAAELFGGIYDAIGRVKELEVEARPRVTRTTEAVHGGSMTRIDRHPTGLEEAAGRASAKIVERTRRQIGPRSDRVGPLLFTGSHTAPFKTERERLRKEVDEGLAGKSEIATEIRQRLAARKKEERAGFAKERIAAGDLATTHAILAAPAWISGLKDDDLPELRAQAERQFFGPQLSQLAAIDDVLKRIDMAERELIAAHDQVLGHVTTARAATQDRTAAIEKLAAESA
jgi:hypothetical protein